MAYWAYLTWQLPSGSVRSCQILAVGPLAERGLSSAGLGCTSIKRVQVRRLNIWDVLDLPKTEGLQLPLWRKARGDDKHNVVLLTLKISSSVGVTYQTRAGPPMHRVAPLENVKCRDSELIPGRWVMRTLRWP